MLSRLPQAPTALTDPSPSVGRGLLTPISRPPVLAAPLAWRAQDACNGGDALPARRRLDEARRRRAGVAEADGRPSGRVEAMVDRSAGAPRRAAPDPAAAAASAAPIRGRDR